MKNSTNIQGMERGVSQANLFGKHACAWHTRAHTNTYTHQSFSICFLLLRFPLPPFPLFTCLGCNFVALSNLFFPPNGVTSLCFDKQSNKGLDCHCGVSCECLSTLLLHTCACTGTQCRACCQESLKFKNHIVILTARIRTLIKNLTGTKCVSVCFSRASTAECLCTLCMHKMPALESRGSWLWTLSTVILAM